MSADPIATGRRMTGADRERQLLDAAEELFADQGYAATSIEDIARTAGVTRPVVYERLGNKESAYLAVVARVREELEDQMMTLALEQTDPRAQLAAGADAYFSYLEEQPRRWTILYGSSTAMVGDLGERLTDARFATVEKIAALLRLHLAEADEERVETFSHLISGAVEQLGRWWLRHPDVRREDVVARFVELSWAGLSPHVVEPG